MNKPLNIIFAGTPDFAACHLQVLVESKHNVIAVYSQPDRPAGRGKKLQASPVKLLALENNIPVYQPQTLKDQEAQQKLTQLNADVMVVVAYGLILPQAVLDAPRFGCLNVHGSLLPKWRGAAPIQRSIWAGDHETGVTIMQMDQGLDTGPMLHKQSIPIEQEDTSASLYEKLAGVGPDALMFTLDNLNSMTPDIQDDSFATYAEKLSKPEARIDWNLDAEQLCRNVRAFNPWPVAYFKREDNPVKVWRAQVIELDQSSVSSKPGEVLAATKKGILVATSKDALLITQLQLPGKKSMPAADVLNSRGNWFEPGTVL